MKTAQKNPPAHSVHSVHKTPTNPPDILAPVREMIQACIQCGTCTGSCPNAFAMDISPRGMWRMVIMGEDEKIAEELFNTKTFTLCSSCYTCTLRCPRGLPLTDAIQALKRIQTRHYPEKAKKNIRFYASFLESVRRHGRVRETEFMTLFFLSMKNPFLPFSFAPLAIRLMAKGKVKPGFPSAGNGALDPIFQKARELEASS